tara:strand:- start:72 stop:734 length:663 start_codon:yes stop_codon:yes gene_type:complete
LAQKYLTKEKIIEIAIALFNEQGVQKVTSRHIAKEMGISHGNLNYHFNTKEDLLLAIYDLMRTEMSESYTGSLQHKTSFEHFHKLLLHLEVFNYKFRFFNMDVLELYRSFPKIQELLTETLELRKTQMYDLFQQFHADGYLDNQYLQNSERLQHMIRIVITFWLSQQEVLINFKFQERGEIAKHIWELITPYMTEKGWEEYRAVLEKYPYDEEVPILVEK